MEIFAYHIDSLTESLIGAQKLCTHPDEEQGGVIIEKAGEFKFIKLKNDYEGTSTAVSLYEANRTEMADLVLPSILKGGWRLYASFHTHPRFSATPSSIDYKNIFEGFKYNIIYSNKDAMFSFTEWLNDLTVTVYIPLKSINTLAKK